MNSQNPNLGARVVFVEPRGANSNVFDRFMTIPMLGPLYLGTIAQEAGYDVSILNENILKRDIRREELMDVDILCVSAMTATVERGKEIAREYKKIREDLGLNSWTLIGGIHASMIPNDVVDDFDQVFVGEAETKILDVLAGVITDKVIKGERLEDMDSSPIPDFKILKNWQNMWAHPVMTSRGCPYDCTFCSVTEMFGQGYRTKSIDRVIEELKAADKKRVFIVDDHFVVKKKRTRAMLKAFDDHNLKFRWSCQVRTELSKDLELVSDMKKAGCRTVYIGFESINPKSLEEMHKRQSVADIERSIKVFRKHSINVHGMFMFGADSDTKEIFKMTSDFCQRSGLSTVQYLIMTPLPGTQLYRQLEKDNRLLHKQWQFYDAMHVVFQPKHLTPLELQEGMIDCFEEFYSYTNAANDAINLFFDTFISMLKQLYRKVYFPSVIPSLSKLFGRGIVKSWVSHNKTYLGYLSVITQGRKKQK
jgi:radical SAM superfamily enzyme YgiQ (UPF0313 family)